MKTSLTLIALSLVSALSFAKSVDSTITNQRLAAFQQAYEGSGPDVSVTPSSRSRAEVIAEAASTPRLPGYVDGSDYEIAHAMFMSRKTREQVLAEASAAKRNEFDAALRHLYGGGR